MKNHMFNTSKFKKWAAKRTKISTLKIFYIQHTKHWMSQRLQKHEEFMTEKERNLFKTSFLTARKQYVSTQSESELKTSTKKSTERFNSKKSLFNMLTESSNMIIMNLFQQEQDESSELQKNSRSKSSSSEIAFQQWYEFKMMKMRLEMMKLKVQKLADQKELIEKNISFQFSILNKFSASVY